jgi:hypothetical protein
LYRHLAAIAQVRGLRRPLRWLNRWYGLAVRIARSPTPIADIRVRVQLKWRVFREKHLQRLAERFANKRIWRPFVAAELPRDATVLAATPPLTRRVVDALGAVIAPSGLAGTVIVDSLEPEIWGAGIAKFALRKLREGYTDVEAEDRIYTAILRSLERVAKATTDIRYRAIPLSSLAKIVVTDRDLFYRRLTAALRGLWRRPGLVLVPRPDACDPTSWLAALRRMAPDKAMVIGQIEGNRRRIRFPRFDPLPPLAVVPTAAMSDERRTRQKRRAEPIVAAIREAAGGDHPVLIICATQPDSIHWPGLEEVALACRSAGLPYAVLVGDRLSWLACKDKQVAVVHVPLYDEVHETADHDRAVRAFFRAVASLRSGGLAQAPDDLPTRLTMAELARSETLWAALAFNLSAIDLIFEILEAVHPRSMVLAPHWSERSVSYGEVAKVLGVPRISFPSVTVAGNNASLVGWDADLVCAYGTQCADAFAAVGYEPRRIVLTGNPGLDRLHRLDRETARKRIAKLRILGRRSRVVVVATSRADPNERAWLSPLVRYCATRGDTQLIAKVHPSFPREGYDEIAPRDDAFAVADEGNIWDYVKLADVCITDFSTAGAEAVIAGTPLVVANLTGKRFPCNNYDELGVALAATTPEQLVAAVEQLLDQPLAAEWEERRAAFLDAYNIGDDGGAAARIAAVLADPQAWLPKAEALCDAAGR